MMEASGKLGGGNSNILFIFTLNLGEMIQFDEHIFQMGWIHQLANDQFNWQKSYS